jgi:hypothetical protein
MSDNILKALEKAIKKEIPLESCPVKEAKNKWMRERVREMVAQKLNIYSLNGPSLVK